MRTCKRPLNSLSPRSFTNTVSSSESRTRSKGSDTGADSVSPASAMEILVPDDGRLDVLGFCS